MTMMITSLVVPSGATTKALAISTTSAQTDALRGGEIVVSSDVACFVVRGASPTATVPAAGGAAGGVPLVAGAQYRLTGGAVGEKLAFITATGSGTVYYTESV